MIRSLSRARKGACSFLCTTFVRYIIFASSSAPSGMGDLSNILNRMKGLAMIKEGVEPSRPFGHQILSLARLPVPPQNRK